MIRLIRRLIWLLPAEDRLLAGGVVALIALLAFAEALLHPMLLKLLMDEAARAEDFRRFIALGILYLAISIALVFSFYGALLLRRALINRVLLHVEMQMFENIQGLDIRGFRKSGTGYYVSRMHKDTMEGLAPAIAFASEAARNLLAIVAFVGVLLWLSWKATLLLFLVVPPVVALANHIGSRIRRVTELERESEARYLDVLTRALEALPFVRSFSSLPPRVEKIVAGRLKAYLDYGYKNLYLSVLQQGANDLTMNFATILAMIVAGYYLFIREFTFGGFMAFTNTFWRAVTSIFNFFKQLPEAQRYDQILHRLEELLTPPPKPYYHLADEARLENVEVKLEGKKALDVPRFEVRPGEHVLLAGPNGAGKTTLLYVLAGLLAPDKGKVWRPERVVSVTLPLALPPLRVEEIVEDHTLLEALGLASYAKERASDLSAGERQKVAIAAALTRDADLYLLDEPLANVDEVTKPIIIELIHKRLEGKSLVTVMHGEKNFQEGFDRTFELDRANG